MNTKTLIFAEYGIGAAVGLVVMVWSFESFHWYNYMEANPEVGSISGGGMWVSYLLFMVGAVIMVTAVMSGLHYAMHGEVER